MIFHPEKSQYAPSRKLDDIPSNHSDVLQHLENQGLLELRGLSIHRDLNVNIYQYHVQRGSETLPKGIFGALVVAII